MSDLIDTDLTGRQAPPSLLSRLPDTVAAKLLLLPRHALEGPELPRLDGEPLARFRLLHDIEQVLIANLGDPELAHLWLHRPSPELLGSRPLDWLGGPTSLIEQVLMRLRRDLADRNGGAK
jgi:hypothetical protein